MQYRNLGRSGTKVSAMCVGTMTWSDTTDQQTADAIVAQAIDAGINFFDTADVYHRGESERVLGKALAAGAQRDRVIIATKFWAPMSDAVNDRGNSRYHITRACENSLRRLGVDHIDLYQVHAFDFTAPLDETLRALDDLVRQGKVRYVGCSKFAPAALAEAVMLSESRGLARFVTEQPPYNLLDRSAENELIWTCQRHGVGLLPWAPLATGVLSGQYKAVGEAPQGSRAARNEIAGFRFNGAAIARADALKAVASAHGVTLAQLSLAWLMHQPVVVAPVLGVRTVEHLTNALVAVDIELTDDELKRIDEIAPPGSAVANYFDSAVLRQFRTAGQQCPSFHPKSR